MRRYFFFILICILFSLSSNAQELRRTKPELPDYIPLLNAVGYEVFTFDIASLRNETYIIQFIIREYLEGALVYDSSKNGSEFSITNRKMISEFPEKIQKEIVSEGLGFDLDKGIYSLGEKISIGLTPTADSLRTVTMSIKNRGSIMFTLSLKPQCISPWKGEYKYGYRPFKVDVIQLGDYIPLLMVGSYWYDQKLNVIRFCGESELPADLSSEMLSKIPHYYVIGVIIRKK